MPRKIFKLLIATLCLYCVSIFAQTTRFPWDEPDKSSASYQSCMSIMRAEFDMTPCGPGYDRGKVCRRYNGRIQRLADQYKYWGFISTSGNEGGGLLGIGEIYTESFEKQPGERWYLDTCGSNEDVDNIIAMSAGQAPKKRIEQDSPEGLALIAQSKRGTQTSLSVKAADRFGALSMATGRGNLYGWAVALPTQEAANKRSLDECNQFGTGNCTVVMEFRNACASYAIDGARSTTAYGWAYGSDKGSVDVDAINQCTNRGGSGSQCTVRVWGCTTR